MQEIINEIAKILALEPGDISLQRYSKPTYSNRKSTPGKWRDIPISKRSHYGLKLDDFSLGQYRIINKRKAADEGYFRIGIASFYMYQLPHCCAIAVSCGAYIGSEYRRKGIGTLMNLFRQRMSTAMGYSLLMCTDIDSNEPQRKILKKNGWKDLGEVRNRRTGNNVLISAIET